MFTLPSRSPLLPAQVRRSGLNAAFAAGTAVPVGDTPEGVALTPDAARGYVANRGSNTVSVIDTATDTVTDTIGTGAGPTFVAISPDGTRAYVTVYDDGLVSVIDTVSNAIVTDIAVGAGATVVALTPDGARAYVTRQTTNTVSVIDTATNTVTATITVGDGSTGLVITQDGTRAYVACLASNTVSVIDTATNTVTATIIVGPVPILLGLTPDGAHLYVTNVGNSTVSVIDTATSTVTAVVGVSAQPRFVAVSPDGSHAYVANSGPGTVSVIDTATNTVVENIGVGGGPTAIAVFPDGTRAYVTNAPANNVSDMATTVIPGHGSTGGQTTVTLTGHNLANATAVHFGTAQAVITANTTTSMTVLTPAGAGAVPVTVTTPGGTGTLGSFYYTPVPALTDISPVAGPVAGSDQEIVITGRNLAGAIDVYFGPTRAVIQTVSDTQITVRAAGAPASGGAAVTVTTPGGTTDGLSYTYVDPSTVTGVSPNAGPTAGGTQVTITGTGLASTDQVTFNGIRAPFEVVSDTTLTATAPPSGADGTVDVIITGPGGTSAGTFTYTPDPNI
ncbi:IPT/TIG domain-containing protein [Kitasatospora sp. NPDC053057]|uniref:IPT/TIG domain-containing protein n=1 Tax=Kitasatospora sp. NPDC053057 TaxID=3364062 RepID=UPI0037CA506D